MRWLFALILIASCNQKTYQETPQVTSSVPTNEVTVGFVGRCQPDMAYVNDLYCPRLIRTCKQWIDPPTALARRCNEFGPATCQAKEEPLTFCIDKEEMAMDYFPIVDVSWKQAERICAANDKRLCQEEEWTLACEGPGHLGYPYGNVRDSTACNIDQEDLVENNIFLDKRESIIEYPRCVSYYGVHNMTGNVDEWVVGKNQEPYRSLLAGGWWGPLRNNCRDQTGGHDEYYHQPSIGFRCCKDR